MIGVYLRNRKGECHMNDLQTIVQNIMKNNFFVENTVTLLVRTHQSTENVAKESKDALAAEEWNVDFHVMEDRTKSGGEPPAETAEKMLQYDLVFCLTKHSLTHTVARKSANAEGISVITMPGITEDMLLHGAMSADYSIVEKETKEMTAKLTEMNQVTIFTGKDYQLTIPIEGRDGVPSTGVFRGKAASGNLPSGEAFIAPIEDHANGKIEINWLIA